MLRQLRKHKLHKAGDTSIKDDGEDPSTPLTITTANNNTDNSNEHGDEESKTKFKIRPNSVACIIAQTLLALIPMILLVYYVNGIKQKSNNNQSKFTATVASAAGAGAAAAVTQKSASENKNSGEHPRMLDLAMDMDMDMDDYNKYDILSDILFVVFRSSIQDKGADGMLEVLRTWGAKYHNKYDIHIAFVSTKSSKFVNSIPPAPNHPDSDPQPVHHFLIEPPFEEETAASLLYVLYSSLVNKYQWVFKCDDVTFVLMENMVLYLNAIHKVMAMEAHAHNPRLQYWWLGNRLQIDAKRTDSIFTSGGAGYLMNRNLIQRVQQEIQQNHLYCKAVSEWEDICISYLLNRRLHIHAFDTRDLSGNEKFQVFDPMSILEFGGIYKLPVEWYSRYKQHLYPHAVIDVERAVASPIMEELSMYPITFHYVKPAWMLAYYQLFYESESCVNIQIIAKQHKFQENDFKKCHVLDKYAIEIARNSLFGDEVWIDNIQRNEMRDDQSQPSKSKT